MGHTYDDYLDTANMADLLYGYNEDPSEYSERINKDRELVRPFHIV